MIFFWSHLILLCYYGRLYPVFYAILLELTIDIRLDSAVGQSVEQAILLVGAAVKGIHGRAQFVGLVLGHLFLCGLGQPTIVKELC